MSFVDRLGLLGVVGACWLVAGCGADAPGSGPGAPTQCSGTWDYYGSSVELPRSVDVGATGTGTGTFTLKERVSDGWRVSRASGDLVVPDPLTDGGTLATLAPGDQIQVTARTQCQPFSGCKSFAVVRDARDGALITATFHYDASALPDFSTALGVPLTLTQACSFRTEDMCFENQIEAQQSLRVVADQPLDLPRHAHAPVTIGGRPYTVWLGSASIVTGSGPAASSHERCLDLGAFWATGGVELTIVRGGEATSST